MKYVKKISAFALLVVLIVSVAQISGMAYSTSLSSIFDTYYCANENAYFFGGEDIGWGVDEVLHTNGTSFTYTYDTSDSYVSSYSSIVQSAATLWSGTLTISYNANSTGRISTYYNTRDSTIAFVDPLADTNGHITSWWMELNRGNSSLCAAAVAHEFGHVAGLADLYTNDSVLMSSYFSGDILSPTAPDKWGAKVITGAHITHSWSYTYYKTTSSGNMHKKYCTQCGGFKSSYCTYTTSVRCSLCGTPQGASMNAINGVERIPY